MDKKLKIGVVGCGQIAQIAHIPYIIELPMFDLNDLCDISDNVVNRLGDKYKIENRFTDYQEMLKKADIDAVVVTTKDHYPVIMAALDAGKHVLVEKPMVFNVQQADDVIAMQKNSGHTLMVGYMKRYDPAYEYALKIIKGMKHIHMIRMHDFAGTYTINNEIYDLIAPTDLSKEIIANNTKAIERGELADIGEDKRKHLELHDILLHLCVHDINVINGIFGIPDRILYAQAYDDLFVNALMEYEDGKKLVWESGNEINIIEWDEQLWVFGTDKRVEIRFPFPYLKNAATIVNVVHNDENRSVEKRIVSSYDEAFKREWRHFYDCVVNQKQPLTSPEEAREDIRFLGELLKEAT
jgi:predicted dehydrogenase